MHHSADELRAFGMTDDMIEDQEWWVLLHDDNITYSLHMGLWIYFILRLLERWFLIISSSSLCCRERFQDVVKVW